MPSMREFETWITPTEAGRELGMSKQGVYYLMETRPKALRVVRTHQGTLIDPASVDRYAAQRRRPQKGKGGGT